jgi:hypothetical protein
MSELSMASLRNCGICTWRTRPRNDMTSAVMNHPLWEATIGMARLSQVLEVSGSTVAFGAS